MTPSVTTAHPHTTITDQTRVKLPIGVWLLLLCTVAGAGSSFAVSQYRINQHEATFEKQERRIERLENDRELLLRIDERITEIKRQLDRNLSK